MVKIHLLSRLGYLSHYFVLQPPVLPTSSEVAEIKKKLNNEILLRKAAEAEVDNLNNQLIHWKNMEVFIALVNFLHYMPIIQSC